LVVSGFGSLPTGRALFLELCGSGGKWLQTLKSLAPISDADGREERAAALSFTWTGLKKIGLPMSALSTFDAAFRQGMMQEDRLRRLGDRRNGKWLGTVIEGGPQWSANTPQRDDIMIVAPDQARTALTATGHREEQIETPQTVHALLLLYEQNETKATEWAIRVENALATQNVKVVRRLPLDLRPDKNGVAREHFGFADGISQPIPFDSQGVVASANGVATNPDKWNGVPLGEFLIGHTNGHHEIAPGPSVPDSADGRAAGLLPHPLAEGSLDFGLDGSYMVVRELKQDVHAFWKSMEDAAARMRMRDPKNCTHVTATWMAERVVGRNLDGHLLCPGGTLPADASGQPQNDFGFHDRDPHGMGCPLGAHVRRGNPRDGLAMKATDAQTLLDASKNHRLLRRGRKYGPATDPGSSGDDNDRGLLFICLNTDISRQFEFVQQTWVLNPNFATLFDQTDPLIGPQGSMTIQQQPLRRIVKVDTFVRMAGGDYFFLPSLPALRYLATL
jgi:deferrochelatase/peroxidase EfeB